MLPFSEYFRGQQRIFHNRISGPVPESFRCPGPHGVLQPAAPFPVSPLFQFPQAAKQFAHIPFSNVQVSGIANSQNTILCRNSQSRLFPVSVCNCDHFSTGMLRQHGSKPVRDAIANRNHLIRAVQHFFLKKSTPLSPKELQLPAIRRVTHIRYPGYSRILLFHF